jgi:hypothetical protein
MSSTEPKTTKPVKKPAGKSSIDFVQEALSDIDKARLSAQGEARAQLDRTTDRLKTLVTDLRERAGDELRDVESSLDRANEQVRVEIGLRAVRAQSSPEGLAKLAAAITTREAELKKK